MARARDTAGACVFWQTPNFTSATRNDRPQTICQIVSLPRQNSTKHARARTSPGTQIHENISRVLSRTCYDIVIIAQVGFAAVAQWNRKGFPFKMSCGRSRREERKKRRENKKTDRENRRFRARVARFSLIFSVAEPGQTTILMIVRQIHSTHSRGTGTHSLRAP